MGWMDGMVWRVRMFCLCGCEGVDMHVEMCGCPACEWIGGVIVGTTE